MPPFTLLRIESDLSTSINVGRSLILLFEAISKKAKFGLGFFGGFIGSLINNLKDPSYVGKNILSITVDNNEIEKTLRKTEIIIFFLLRTKLNKYL